MDAANSLTGAPASAGQAPSFPDHFGAPWLRQIIHTLLNRLAEDLAEGGSEEDIRQRFEEDLSSETNAERIALTEVNRAMQAAALWAYHRSGVTSVRWVTAHDAKVCPACLKNQNAGAHPLGTPFPSGAIAPPEHPRCRCALVPA